MTISRKFIHTPTNTAAPHNVTTHSVGLRRAPTLPSADRAPQPDIAHRMKAAFLSTSYVEVGFSDGPKQLQEVRTFLTRTDTSAIENTSRRQPARTNPMPTSSFCNAPNMPPAVTRTTTISSPARKSTAVG